MGRENGGVTSGGKPEDVARALGLDPTTRTSRGAKKAILRVLAVATIAAVVIGGGKAVLSRRGQGPTKYITAEVTRGDLRVTVTATGTLAALGAVEVGSEVSGRVQSVFVDYNSPVTKGQVLAEIDPVALRAEQTQAGAQLAASNAAVQTAEATLLETTQALDRAEAQLAKGLVATKDVEAARAASARAKASLASAKANAALSSAQVSSSVWKLGKTKILSPIDGIVLSRSVEPGQTVAASFQTPVLFKLATDLSSLELKVQVDEADVGRVREGLSAEFRVDAYADKVFPSKVKSVRNEPKTSSNVVTYEAVLTVDNAEQLLRPGMTATAVITSELHPNVMLVPNAALRFVPPVPKGPGPPGGNANAGPPITPSPTGAKTRKRVYLLDPRGMPAPADLTAGATDGTKTEATETSLAIGTKVVVDLEEGLP